MFRISTVLSILCLVVASTAQARPNWEAYGLQVAPAEAGRVVAAIETFMATDAGQKVPGAYSLMQATMDGADPTTHSIIWTTDSVAERATYMQSMEGNEDWNSFVETLTGLTRGFASYRMAFVKTWGDAGSTDPIWYIHMLSIEDGAAYLEELDKLMTSELGRTFTGWMVFSRVVAGGLSPATHLISVGFETEAEAEDWEARLEASPANAAFMKATAGTYRYLGASILTTIKTWGELGP